MVSNTPVQWLRYSEVYNLQEVVGDLSVEDVQLTEEAFPGLIIRLANKYNRFVISERNIWPVQHYKLNATCLPKVIPSTQSDPSS